MKRILILLALLFVVGCCTQEVKDMSGRQCDRLEALNAMVNAGTDPAAQPITLDRLKPLTKVLYEVQANIDALMRGKDVPFPDAEK